MHKTNVNNKMLITIINSEDQHHRRMQRRVIINEWNGMNISNEPTIK